MHPAASTSQRPRTVRLVLDVPTPDESWVLSEENMPESSAHRDTVDLLKLLLLAFVARTQRSAHVAANLACRWDRDHPSIGVDPDIALIEPAPPSEASALRSLRTWEPGHVPPRFAVEVVSPTNPNKDYVTAPAKYAALGTRELVIFDPEHLGPAVMGGPHVLQVWRRTDDSRTMARVYAGHGPAYSSELSAWLIPTPQGRLRIADDEQGRSPWLTREEAEAEAHKQEAAARKQEAEAREREAAARKQAEDALRRSIEDVCDLCDVPLDDARRAHLASLDAAGLDQLRRHLKAHRAWPG